MKKGVLIVLLSTISIMAQVNNLWLPAVFSDNMVLQQKSNCRVWGKTVPGQTVVVSGNWGVKTEVKADKNGAWIATVKTKKAGGPYELAVVAGSEKRTLKNILFGEVWVCSGQSNMEMPLAGWPPNDTIQGSAEAISGADFPNLRLFTVARNYTVDKQSDCNGTWAVCSPSTVPGFSATAFFYGRKLMKELKVPIGLIHTSWGGTPAQAWTEADFLKPYPEYYKIVDNLNGIAGEVNALDAWLGKQKQIPVAELPEVIRWKNLQFDDAECSAKAYNDTHWGTMELPILWEKTALGDFDGVVWFRKTITLPEEMRSKELVLYCGLIDDMDATYVNGVLVGAAETGGKWQDQRVYKISKEVNNDSVLVIACRVIDNQGGGGIWGRPEGLKLAAIDDERIQIHLSGSWKYFPVAEYKNNTFYFWGNDIAAYQAKPKVTMSFGA
ncbi:MAG: glycosyl hydrolase family 2, partial [Ignavibacteriales bacterium]|nr:glycosyl hydrolase family 2 [Ignavibacteriales bacterium]